uniref:Uncharacterized protein n=1 Tax=Castor canadensis TaxID=51338 RepID=A0A8C0XTD2_CASCN
MGGGRGLLGRESPWPAAGAPGRVGCAASRRAPPPSRGRCNVPCALLSPPARVVLAFVPGIALQAPAAAAAGPRSGARRRRPVLPARPLPCTLGRCPGPQLQAGLALHTGHTTHGRPLSAAPAMPPACISLPTHLRCAAITIHRTCCVPFKQYC